ncbi:MAG TPA: EamA family transporter, partial [Candidatus Limnocylindria bacterium]|nr:EamA family transporter [Candidatus Limnocylindria bacterium]
MSVFVVLLILFAAALHASWNALLRAGADRLWAMTIMALATAAVCGV